MHWVQPLKVTNNEGKYDIQVLVEGGGTTGQVDAISLGIARALVELNEENRIELRKFGLLTRDPRMVERKNMDKRKREKDFNFLKDNFFINQTYFLFKYGSANLIWSHS